MEQEHPKCGVPLNSQCSQVLRGVHAPHRNFAMWLPTELNETHMLSSSVTTRKAETMNRCTELLVAMSVLVLLAISSGCGQATASASSQIDPESTVPVQIQVEEMNCAIYCKATVENTLFIQPGVAHVQVDFDSKIATCMVDPEQFDSSKALAALEDSRYPGKLLATANGLNK